MILDPKRKGMVLACMTEEEQLEIKRCADSDHGLMVLDGGGKWKWEHGAHGDSLNWTYWPKDKPAYDAVVRKLEMDIRGGVIAQGCMRIVFPGNHDNRGYTYLRCFHTLEDADAAREFYTQHGRVPPRGGWSRPFDDSGTLLKYVLCVKPPCG